MKQYSHVQNFRMKLLLSLTILYLKLLPQLVVTRAAASSNPQGHLSDSSFSGKIGAVLPESQFAKPGLVLHSSDTSKEQNVKNNQGKDFLYTPCTEIINDQTRSCSQSFTLLSIVQLEQDDHT